MSVNKLFGIVLLLWLQSSVVRAQNLNPLNVTNIVPPSPDVAAMAKYITMPVSYSTGVPEISVPIYTLKSGDLSLPVTLSYNASGIKVEEVATWVGLGWNLNSGGSVSRIVRGLPDDWDASKGFLYTTKTQAYILGLPYDSPERYDLFAEQIYANTLDVEPDIYIFSVQGYSGRFYFDQRQRKFVCTPNQNIKIDYSVNGTGQITGWIFTLPNGVKCYFGLSADNGRSTTESFVTQQTINVGTSVSIGGANSSPGYISSWPVMDIVSPQTKKISFYYTVLNDENFGRSGEVTDYKGNSGCDAATDQTNASFYIHTTTKAYINRISSDLSDVLFIAGTEDRQDMSGSSKKLDSIVIKNKDNSILECYGFNYGYFQSTDATSIPSMPNAVAKKRLYLRSLLQTDASNMVSLPFNFYYDTTNILPSRLSASQDYWGYYNGKSNGSFLTPTITNASIYGSGSGYRAGADRRVDSVFARSCILNKIQYPTGGFTEYTYQPNKSASSGSDFYFTSYQPSNVRTGSFMIVNNPFIEVSTNVYVDSFEVNNITGQATLVSSCDGCTTDFTSDCPLRATITGITDPSFIVAVRRNDNYYLTLPNGKYSVTARIIPNDNYPNPSFSVALNWSELIDPNNLLIGGQRVAKIVSDDGVGHTLSKSFDYNSFTNPATSSGVLYNLPVSVYKTYCGYSSGGEVTPGVTKVVSNSALPLSSENGNLVTYTNVTEYSDENKSSFKTEYTFSTTPQYIAGPGTNIYPFPPNIQSDWRGGLLTDKKEYEKLSEGSHRILTHEEHFYKNFQRLEYDSFGIKVSPYPTREPPSFGVAPYSFATEWYLTDSTVTSQYAYNNGNTTILSHPVKNFYNNNFLPANIQSLNSKGEVVHTKSWYPADYNNVSGYNINSLLDAGIIEVPVKQEISVNGKITSGRIIQYNTKGQPCSIYSYENAALADTTTHDRSTVLETNYQLINSLSYGTDGTLQQAVKRGGSTVSYLWNYAGTYPVAEVTNADYSSSSYTSFEGDGTGNWDYTSSGIVSDGVTGTKAFSLTNNNIVRTSLSSAVSYIGTYWLKNSSGSCSLGGSAILSKNGWTLYQTSLSGITSLMVSGNGIIDELRLYPQKAMMTTYTYNPLIGISSQCDANNKITYYEYDSLGRLQLIKDQDKNIIKTFDYKYKEAQ